MGARATGSRRYLARAHFTAFPLRTGFSRCPGARLSAFAEAEGANR